jgi:hypothetical protein
MKVKLLFIGVIFTLKLCAQNTIKIISDDSLVFDGDVKVSLFQINDKTKLLRISNTDSTFLYKKYTSLGRLYSVYETNLKGQKRGFYFYYDTIQETKTYSQIEKNNVFQSVTYNKNNDTIIFEKMLSDSFVEHKTIDDSFIKHWYTNGQQIYIGKYLKIDKKTGRVLEKGNYRPIFQNDIINEVKYKERLQKYGMVYTFRGTLPAIELPVGEWFFYDYSGKLIKKVKYNWKDIVRF